MKPLQYTRHAKNRMRMRNISEAEITVAIGAPDFTESSVDGRVSVWKLSTDKFLRVTYKDLADRIVIITAVKKKKGWR